MDFRVLALALVLASCHKPQPVPGQPPPPAPAPAPIVLPAAPLLDAAGHDLLLEFEVGGRTGYNPHPEWPEAASGITVGVGYDCGYFSRAVIRSDWSKLAERERLAETAGATGRRARDLLSGVRDIYVEWNMALGVFDNVDVAREFSQAQHALFGFDNLRPNAQAALISLGFNRGWGMSGPNRAQMRGVRDAAPRRDYAEMASQIRQMIPLWRGTPIERGMERRRQAEAQLMETP